MSFYKELLDATFPNHGWIHNMPIRGSRPKHPGNILAWYEPEMKIALTPFVSHEQEQYQEDECERLGIRLVAMLDSEEETFALLKSLGLIPPFDYQLCVNRFAYLIRYRKDSEQLIQRYTKMVAPPKDVRPLKEEHSLEDELFALLSRSEANIEALELMVQNTLERVRESRFPPSDKVDLNAYRLYDYRALPETVALWIDGGSIPHNSYHEERDMAKGIITLVFKHPYSRKEMECLKGLLMRPDDFKW